jgi:TolB protein
MDRRPKAGRAAKAMFVALALLACGAPAAEAAYSPATMGRILFQSNRDGDFDIYSVNADGTNPVNLTPDNASNDGDPAISPDGRLIAFQRQTPTYHLFVMRPGSPAVDISTGTTDQDIEPAFSPDGRRIVFNRMEGGDQDIYIVNIDGSGLTNLTPTSAEVDFSPAFTPDGRILFSRFVGATIDLFAMKADGSGQVNLTQTPGVDESSRPAPSPDGKRIAIGSSTGGSDYDVVTLDPFGKNPLSLTAGSTTNDFDPEYFADGSRIAFVSRRDGGDRDLWVMGPTGAGPVNLIAPDGPTIDDDAPAAEYIFFCGKRRATIVGGEAGDRIKGTKRADVIVGNGGRDVINGKGGADRICGGAGKDELRGAGGRDRLSGGAGKDRLFGGKGTDVLKGGKGKDVERQ